MRLWPSQKAALAAAKDKDLLALWAQPRSGKTATALLWALRKRPDWVLVVGPKIASPVWAEAVRSWAPNSAEFFAIAAGKPDQDPKALRAVRDSLGRVPVVFTNYELCAARSWPRVSAALKALQGALGDSGCAILDEAHLIKTPSSQSGRNLRRVAPMFRYRAILTGTPVSNANAVTETYGQWTFLDPSIRARFPSAKSFREHFGEWASYRGFPELIAARNVGELHALLSEHVVTLADRANELRPRVLRFTPSKAVATVLRDLRRTNTATLPDGTELYAELPITRLGLERRVAGGTAWRGGHKRRLRALTHALDTHPGKAVVACVLLDEVAAVAEYLREGGRPVFVITGSCRDKHAVLDTFSEHPSESAVLVVQPATVSTAVDMRAAQQVVWYTLTSKYSEYKQMSDRVKLANSPLVTILVAEGTVDEALLRTAMQNRKHLTNTMNGVTNGG